MDSTYYYLIWAFMGALIGTFLTYVVVSNFLYRKLVSFEKAMNELYLRVCIVEERSRVTKDLPVIEERTKLLEYLPAIEERTRLLQSMPQIEERTQMIPWFLNYALAEGQKEADTEETQRLPVIGKK